MCVDCKVEKLVNISSHGNKFHGSEYKHNMGRTITYFTHVYSIKINREEKDFRE